MPEYRIDPVTQQRVIIAPERLQRPGALIRRGSPTAWSQSDSDQTAAPCPFCIGHESATPPAVATVTTGALPGEWQVRVVPNLYPAINLTIERVHEAAVSDSAQLLLAEPAGGRHEVVIESPQHLHSLTELPTPHIRSVLDAYIQRIAAHRRVPGIVHTTIFKNHGPLAGASLSHTHSQILSLDHVSPAVDRELRHTRQYMVQRQQCLICSIIHRELSAGMRVVVENNEFAVICPFASRLPYEFRIYPKRHCARFEQQLPDELDALAATIRRSLSNLEKLSEHVPYNYLIHSAPFDSDVSEHYHWHMEVLPRLASVAGFKWGSNIHINPVSPEQAARELQPTGSYRD